MLYLYRLFDRWKRELVHGAMSASTLRDKDRAFQAFLFDLLIQRIEITGINGSLLLAGKLGAGGTRDDEWQAG